MPDRGRQNVLLMVNLQLAGWAPLRVRIRDISAGGCKVYAPHALVRGTRLKLELPGLGWISGEVAWSNDSGFGVRFLQPVNPSAARQRVTGDFSTPQIAMPVLKRVA